MDILFEKVEQKELGKMGFTGIAEEVPVGHARLFCRGEHAAELLDIWLEDKDGEKISWQEFAEAFFRYLKKQGYTELWMTSEDEDEGEDLGFKLEEWDNSGWYPKYFFRKEL